MNFTAKLDKVIRDIPEYRWFSGTFRGKGGIFLLDAGLMYQLDRDTLHVGVTPDEVVRSYAPVNLRYTMGVDVCKPRNTLPAVGEAFICNSGAYHRINDRFCLHLNRSRLFAIPLGGDCFSNIMLASLSVEVLSV